jgi:broad specificity phosphatase PhoE
MEGKSNKEYLEELLSGSQVLLQRHANSQFNYEDTALKEKDYTDEEYKVLRIKDELRDAPLSQLGIDQCLEAQQIANKLTVEVILVSPLRRTLETAYHTFKEHSNFENIEFILTPNLREAIDTT